MKASEFRALIKEEVQKILKEEESNNSTLVQTVADLYEKMISLPNRYGDIDDEAVDYEMERLVKKVGLTPEQKKKRGAAKYNLFTFGEAPEFEVLTDLQLKVLEPFLKDVIKEKFFSQGSKWLGTKIKRNDW